MTVTIASTQEVCEQGVGLYGTGADAHLVMYGNPAPAGNRKVVIALHGRSLTGVTWGPVTGDTAYEHVRALARRGYAVVSIDAAGPFAWSAAAEMTAITNAITVAQTRFGGTKVGLLGFSMGGLAALNYAKRFPAKVAGSMIWSPCTDLSWAYNNSYTPPYATGGISPLASFQTEINAAYACTTSTYAASTSGYRIADEYATWTSLAPIKVIHAADDATVPIAQARAFVTGVNSASVTLHELTTGGHGPWTGIDPSETSAFFDSLSFP